MALSEKVRAIKSYVEEGKDEYCNFIQNEKCYFTRFEISQLQKIGRLKDCVRLQNSVSGDDELFNQLQKQMEEIIIVQALPSLYEKVDNNVAKMIMSGVKKM